MSTAINSDEQEDYNFVKNDTTEEESVVYDESFESEKTSTGTQVEDLYNNILSKSPNTGCSTF